VSAGLDVVGWSTETAPRFHAVYDAAFRDRPGFPGWTAAEWIEGLMEDGVRPEWSMLATLPGIGDAGFITGIAADAGSAAPDGWVDQVGVVPAARRRGLACALITAALARMSADGASHAWLTVNVNNPAASLYRRLGFVSRGRRARFQR